MTIDYDHEPIETRVTVAEPKLPEIRSLVLSGVDLSAYQTTVLREAHQRLATRQRGVEMAEEQVQHAVRGYTAAIAAKEQRQVDMYWQQQKNRRNVLTRRRRQVETAERFLALVEGGHLPIPRLPAVRMDWLKDPLPPEVLETLAAEKKHGLFEEFRVVTGEETTEWGFPTTRRQRGRDPILVGLCDGEMFPLAWWR